MHMRMYTDTYTYKYIIHTYTYRNTYMYTHNISGSAQNYIKIETSLLRRYDFKCLLYIMNVQFKS